MFLNVLRALGWLTRFLVLGVPSILLAGWVVIREPFGPPAGSIAAGAKAGACLLIAFVALLAALFGGPRSDP